jgi:hypothetical protein
MLGNFLVTARSARRSLGTGSMEIRYGKLNRTLGVAVRIGRWSLMAADVSLEAGGVLAAFPVAEYCETNGCGSPMLLKAIEGRCDAAWVRARIPAVFGFTPPLAQVEKALLDVGFIAIDMETSPLEAIPFSCTDYYGRTRLEFADDDDDRSSEVALAFWSALLAKPEVLHDFEERVPHLGASVTLVFGCRDGHVFYDEEPELAIPRPVDEAADRRDMLRADRAFYDSLGDERPDSPCKREGCGRGAVRLSVFCRVHHFAVVMRRPCPFDH